MTGLESSPETNEGSRPIPPSTPVRHSLRQRASSAAGWSLSQNAAREVFAFVTFVVLARWFLDESDFGIVALANSFVVFAGLLVRNGLVSAIIQRPEIGDRHRTAAFWCGVLLSTLAGLSLSVLAWTPLADMIEDPRLPAIIAALALSLLPMSAGAVHEAELRRRLEFRAMAVRGLVAAVAGSLAAIAAALAGAGVWALVVQSWTTALASSAMLWLLLPWRPSLRLPLREAKELLPMSVSVTGLALMNQANELLERLIIGTVLGAPALGFYYVGQRIIQAVHAVLTQGVNGVALPAFSEVRGDLARARRGYLFAVRVCAAATFPIFVGIAILADELVRSLFGPEWQMSATVLQVLAIGAAPSSVFFFNQPLMVALGRPNKALRVTTTATTALVPLLLIGSAWGVLGVAVAVVLRQAVLVIHWIVVLRAEIRLAVSELVQALVRPALASLAMALAIWLAESLFGPGLAGLVGATAAGAATYIFSLFVIDRDVRTFVLSFMRFPKLGLNA